MNSHKETFKDVDVPKKLLLVLQLVLSGTLPQVHVVVISSQFSAMMSAILNLLLKSRKVLIQNHSSTLVYK